MVHTFHEPVAHERGLDADDFLMLRASASVAESEGYSGLAKPILSRSLHEFGLGL